MPPKRKAAVAEEGAEGGAAAPVAEKKPRKGSLPVSPHAGPDTAAMVAGPFLPAASMAAVDIPARPAGVKILCYNVNGLRAAVKGDKGVALRAWLAREDPDVLCLQEVKADADAIAKEKLADLFKPALPFAYFAPGDPAAAGFKKGYAG